MKLIQIKLNQMQFFEERGQPEYPGENWSTRGKTSQSREENQQTQPKNDAESGNRTRVTLVGGECSHLYATTDPKLNYTSARVDHTQHLI